MWGHMSGYGWDAGGMGIGMLLFWGVLVAGVVMLVKCSMRSCGRRGQERSALDILEERYARGEIERAEFEQKKRDLKG